MCATLAAAAALTLTNVQVSVIDPLIKLQKSDPIPAGSYRAEVARGEVAEWKVVVRSDTRLDSVKVSCSKMEGLGRPHVRTVAYVPVDRPAAEPASDRIGKPPGEYPDPLLEEMPQRVDASENQSFWVDLPITDDAPVGDYSAEVRVSARTGGAQVLARTEIRLHVYDVTVGKSRLWVTNWFTTGSGHMPGAEKPGSAEEAAYLRQMARKMAAHRQDVALISPLDLARFSWSPDGAMKADFKGFDEQVSIFKKAGVIGRIEGGHLGGRLGDWNSQFGLRVEVSENGKAVSKTVPSDSPEADRFYSQFLPLLVRHLKQRGMWGIYMQHIADEPIDSNSKTYQMAADLVRKYAPGLKIVEATHTEQLVGSIDVWVPQLDFADKGYDFYKARQGKGEEFWTYTCIWPEGEYANRFIELPLIKTRILHWINYRFGITGYLHWGYNFWVKGSPFTDLTRAGEGEFLPAGDSWIVYPKDGKLLDSIRYETMRDGIADYELLAKLGDKDPGAAQRLAERVVQGFTKYDTGVDDFRQVRRELLTDLEP